jgi:cellulose synthase/poly-beta-1,6-N-acetylglucosamine synthase-like glycosyltransferase
MTFGDVLLYVTTFFGLFTSIYFLLTLGDMRSKRKVKQVFVYPKVSVVVPCFNEEETVVKTLESLLALDYEREKLEILVVDDGSTDNTFKIASRFAKDNPDALIRVFRKKNGGKFTALNFALEKATGEFFGALDADSFVDKHALKRIMNRFTHEKVMAVTPSMKVYKPKGFLQRMQAAEYLLGVFLRQVFADLGSIHVTPGPFSFYRMSFFRKYGGYRKAFHTEDIEVALRAQLHNEIIDNAVDAFVFTVAPNDWKTLRKQRLRWYYGFLQNVFSYKKLFSRKHGHLGMFILPSSFISVFLVIVSVSYALVMLVREFFERFLSWRAVNYDIHFPTFTFDSFFWNSSPVALLALVAIVTGLFIFLIASTFGKERFPVLSYSFFVLTYSFFFAFWWVISLFHVVSKKNVAWGHKSGVDNE